MFSVLRFVTMQPLFVSLNANLVHSPDSYLHNLKGYLELW